MTGACVAAMLLVCAVATRASADGASEPAASQGTPSIEESKTAAVYPSDQDDHYHDRGAGRKHGPPMPLPLPKLCPLVKARCVFGCRKMTHDNQSTPLANGA